MIYMPRLNLAILYSHFTHKPLWMQENASLNQQQDVDRSIAEAYEAADFLTGFVVQAEMNDRGNFGKMPQANA